MGRLQTMRLAILVGVLVAMFAAPTLQVARGDDPPPAKAETKAEDTSANISALVEQLGDADFFRREQAQKQLAALGFEAFDALSEAENHLDIEIAERAKFLIRQMQIAWTTDADAPEVKKLLQNYNQRSEEDRLTTMQQLAELPEQKGVPTLCRLVRFERSGVYSKYAAVKLIEQKLPADTDWKARAQLIEQGVGRSTRPAAQWLRAYVAAHSVTSKADSPWAALAESEEHTLREFPQQTRPGIAVALWRQQVELLDRLNDRPASQQAMLRIVALQTGSSESLMKLVGWLVEREAWPVIDEVAVRYRDTFEQDVQLLYTLAYARRKQGNEAGAKTSVEAALKLNKGNSRGHLQAGYVVQQRGYIDWAIEEYRQCIAEGGPGQTMTLQGQWFLSELLHDQGKYEDAGKVLVDNAAAMEANIKGGRIELNAGRELEPVKSRMHYFFAKHWEEKHDRVKQREELLKGIGEDPTDADVLIALYRLPDADDALKQRTKDLIGKAAVQFREQITTEPDDATNYNQLAWLIANTEGDYQEALQASKKSLELRAGTAGYLDTLGRCYYAVGDLENAVKTQSQAVELEPSSNLMQHQLKFFREALEQKKSGTKPDGDKTKPDGDKAKAEAEKP